MPSFDLCTDTGADKVFFPNGHGALTGTYEEVDCSQWSGADSTVSQWNGACLAGETAGLWPGTTGCGNQGEVHPVYAYHLCPEDIHRDIGVEVPW